MAKTGEKFETHIYTRWGERKPQGKRETDSRDETLKEAYIHIPQPAAKAYDIFMSNEARANTRYDAYDEDNNFIATLKAQGNAGAGSVYAKQFSGSGDLKALTPWIRRYEITDSDVLEVEFLSDTSIRITKK